MLSRLFLVFPIALSIAWYTPLVNVALADQSFEENTDRPGNDFRNFDLNPPQPGSFGGPVDICRENCQREDNCKAWTFVKAGIQGPNARCWLKTSIPAAHQNNCCTSGVPVRELESNIDRPGSDYNNFDLTSAEPNLCKSACERDGPKCNAWTFVRPGVQGPNARCWLKNSVPPAFTNICCTSGAPGPIIK
jgi:PAN domain